MTSTYYSNKVLVTGASGFIAVHIVSQLFSHGFEIVGTVRSPEKGDWLAKRYPGFKYEILRDLTDQSAIETIFQKHQDIKFVLHVASPEYNGPSDYVKNMVEPSVKGTKFLLEAAHKFSPNVKKFVLTSSFVTVCDLSKGPYQPDLTITEDSWVDLNLNDAEAHWLAGYTVAKKLAEKAVWEFKESQKPNFAVAAIIVPGALGPPIHNVT